MDQPVKAYVINLARRPDRLRRFMGWNHAHGLDLEIVSAVDGRGVDRQALMAAGLLASDHEGFTDGAIGAALSHRAQWEACVRDGVPRMIFEDDSCLRKGFSLHAAAIMTTMAKCDVIFFGYNFDAALTLKLDDDMYSAIYFSDLARNDDEYFNKYAHSAHQIRCPWLARGVMVWGILGYAVSPKGARRLLDCCFPLSGAAEVRMHAEQRSTPATGLDGMINAALQRDQIRALVCYPPLVIGPNDQSDIQIRPEVPARRT